MRQVQRVCALVALVSALCGLLQAQVTTGTILGTVKDGTGAVVPGATVEVQNVDTGISRTVTTDSQGFYRASNLSLGQYQVSASVSGFQTEVRRGITLNIGQNAVIDFSLRVGSVAETVEVTGEAPLVETSSATVAGLVNERQVQDLPLNARNLLELATFEAGIALSETGGSSPRHGFGTKLTIAGTRWNANLFQLDGLDISNAGNTAGSAAGIMMGAETIREFNIVSNAYSAEFGKHSGGVFNAVTKSGTNSLHGSVFEFLRNEKMDARNFFDGEKPGYRRNQFGASVGGPILKDRSFFFGSYEGLRERLPLTEFYTVPSLDMRQGRLEAPAGSGRFTEIPIAAAVRPWLALYPSPNGQDFRDGTAEFIVPQSYPTDSDFYTVRVDHTISDKDSLWGRYTQDRATRNTPADVTLQPQDVTGLYYVAVGETRIFSPSVINQFVFGFNQSDIANEQVLLEGVKLPQETFTGYSRKGVLAGVSVTGLSGLGGSFSLPSSTVMRGYQFKDDLFYTTGSHSFKFGFNAQKTMYEEVSTSGRNGTYAFTSLADFLQGRPDVFRAQLPQTLDEIAAFPRQSLFGFYAQDDYRVTPRLTLNLGLRYEFVTTIAERDGRLANAKDYFASPVPSQTLVGNGVVLNPSLKNWAPRVGLAWDPTGSGKTSIRAGAGVYHDQIFIRGSFANSLRNVPPINNTGEIRGRNARFPDAYTTQLDLLGATPGMEGWQYVPEQPTIYKYSFDLEREVFANTSVDLGYSGTRGVHLVRVITVNPRIAQEVNGRLFVPTSAPFWSPNWGRIRPRFTDTESDYHALRLTVKKRFSNGLQFTTAYTWSKSTDDSSNFSGSGDFDNSGTGIYRGLKETGISSFDIRNHFSANFTYDLPGSGLTGAAGKVLGGWQMSGILSLRDGLPFTPTVQTPSHFTDVAGRPDVRVGATTNYDTRNPNAYFDVAGFMPPPTNTMGNGGRGILTSPGSVKFDFVLTKETSLTERISLQFRSEFYNLFNRANFGLPNSRLFVRSGAVDPAVGRITNTTTTSRQMQLGMRLVF